MLQKIDKIIDRFLNCKILKNILLAQLFLIPHTLIATTYNISVIPLLIMNLSFGLAISFFSKAIKEFVNEKESL